MDLDYPLELHNEHNSFALCPDHLDGRLDAHLWNRRNYGIYYEGLKFVIEKGLILRNIHYGIKFREYAFTKPFIELNTKLRQEAPTKFQGDVFKLKMNSGYGKHGENKENRIDVKFTKSEKEFLKEVGKPTFRERMILDDYVNMVSLCKGTVYEDKPVYVAQTILDKSKIILQKYYYNHLLPLFGNKLVILYSDTDSLIFQVFTDNFYADIALYAPEYYDTSGYKMNKHFEKNGFPIGLNKKRPGFMEDEHPNDPILEFIGTSAKQYYYKTESGEKVIKAKGISDRSNVLNRDDFYNAVFEKKEKDDVVQTQIRSFNLRNYTISMKKKTFSVDQKRIVLDDNVSTLAHGHWRDIGVCILPETFPLPKKGTLGRLCLKQLREEYRKKLYPPI